MTTPLDPRTLRWVARKLVRDSNDTMGIITKDIITNGAANSHGRARLQGWAGAAGEWSRSFLGEAKAIEKRRTKKAGKRG